MPHLKHISGTGSPILVTGSRGEIRNLFIRPVKLKFNGISPGAVSSVDQFQGLVQTAVMVDTGFGNNIARMIFPDYS
ncbi:hypothetical protein [Syntrophomonas curvata]